LKIANGLAGSAASLVPASVPRPVAKLVVVGISSLVALWLFGKVSLDISYIHALCNLTMQWHQMTCTGVRLPCIRHANALLLSHTRHDKHWHACSVKLCAIRCYVLEKLYADRNVLHLQLVSTVFTVAAVGGAVFLFLKSRGAKPEASSDVADDAIDPVASARRIMDKYK